MMTPLSLILALSLVFIPIVRSLSCVHSPFQCPLSSSDSLDPAIVSALGSTDILPFGDAKFACAALKQAFAANGSVEQASDGESYSQLVKENYSARCWREVACVLSPESSAEVSRIVVMLSTLGVKFAIRSGGHSYSPGFASGEQDAVLISLQKLSHIELSRDKSTVHIGPGNRWNAVYSRLQDENLTVIGGRVGDVGVGGFLLGGGVSYFANEHGLALDNIRSYEVVLGSGQIVIASEQQNSDLYQGLRGGGANFGIVTSYELETRPLDTLYYEVRVWGADKTPEVLEAISEWQEIGQKEDKLANIAVQFQPTIALVMFVYAKPSFEPASFDAIYRVSGFTHFVPPTNGSLTDLLRISEGGFPTGTRIAGETFSHRVDAAFAVDAYNIFLEETKRLPEGASGTWVFAPIAANTIEVGRTRSGGNLLGLDAVPQKWYEWFITWTDLSQDDTVLSISDSITERLVEAAKVKNVFLPYLFMNTAGPSQPVLQSFGTKNLEKINAIATKYDPEQIFQRFQGEGYLVRAT